MKSFFKKYGALIAVLPVVFLCFAVYSRYKAGMFIDEIYTYGLANSHYAPFIDDAVGGSLTDTLITREDMLEYVSVGDGDAFDFGSVYYNQVNDVHPPLYYWLLNFVCSIFRNSFSKLTGLGLNAVILLYGLIMLYKLVYELSGSRFGAALSVLLYGTSAIGLSTAIMIRMYVLLAALTVTLAYLAVKIIGGRRGSVFPLFGAIITLGLLTQYYFVFYAFFLCGIIVVFLLVKKDWPALWRFVLFALGGVALMVLIFPACFDHLLSGALVSGQNAAENLGNTAQYAGRLSYYFRQLYRQAEPAVWISAAAALLSLPAFLKNRGERDSGRKERSIAAVCVLLPAFAAYVLAALISPIKAIRYEYNLVPVLFIIPGFFAGAAVSLNDNRRLLTAVAAAVLAVSALVSVQFLRTRRGPDYVFPEYLEYNAALAKYAGCPCVYITDEHFEPVTMDLLQLMLFDDVFTTNAPASHKLAEYVQNNGNAGSIVVYIDVDEFWSSGYNSSSVLEELTAALDCECTGMLYSNGASEVYILTK